MHPERQKEKVQNYSLPVFSVPAMFWSAVIDRVCVNKDRRISGNGISFGWSKIKRNPLCVEREDQCRTVHVKCLQNSNRRSPRRS